MKLGRTTSVFRIFDEAKAREFYVGFLGFSIDWEHRFEENFPLYMGLLRDDCRLHLSEHHGDCCPGGAVRIEVENIEELHKWLVDKDYKYAKPGLEETPWNTREVSVTDPFGNRLTFFEPLAK
ncbi:MAG: glyoxalase superfamily protein [Methyloligellaceae bacterium]